VTNIALSVVIPTYGRSKDLEGLLRSVEPDEKTHEVIVIDDCSEDPSEFDTLKKGYPDVRFVHLKQNVGPGQARNEGARLARGGIILYLDSDTELVSGGINLLIDFSRKHPDIKIFSGWDSPVPLNSGFFPRFKALFMIVGAPKTDADVSFIAGRCFAIKKDAMLESGGFNAEYKGADVEDFELGYRLKRSYGQIRYLSGLRVHHRYPSLLNQFKLYFKRIRMWMELRSSRGGFDDSFGTSQNDAIIQLLSAFWPFAFILSLALGFFSAGFVFLVAAVWVNREFAVLCLKEEGIMFMIMSVLCHSFLAIAVLTGALFELVRKPNLIFGILGRRSQR
jgi:GT2 family glycosyltransferase